MPCSWGLDGMIGPYPMNMGWPVARDLLHLPRRRKPDGQDMEDVTHASGHPAAQAGRTGEEGDRPAAVPGMSDGLANDAPSMSSRPVRCGALEFNATLRGK